MTGTTAPMPDVTSSRLTTALVASIALHTIVVTFLLLHVDEPPVPAETPIVLLPLSIEGSGGGGGGPIPGPPEPPAGPPEPEPAPAAAPAAPTVTPKLTAPPVVKKVTKPKKPVPPQEAPKPAEVASTGPQGAAPDAVGTGTSASGTGTGTGTGGGGGGAGTGDGTGGDGSGGARPAHGSNPKPPYPIAARRLGQEGVVMLEVVVKPDGRAGDVRIRRSSGHPMLDESALSTVRDRWKFIPAKRNGAPIEATVTFPIRFQLDQG